MVIKQLIYIYKLTFILSLFSVVLYENIAISQVGKHIKTGSKYVDFKFMPDMRNLPFKKKMFNNVYSSINEIVSTYYYLNNAEEIFNLVVLYEYDTNKYIVSGNLKRKIQKVDYITGDGNSIKLLLGNCNNKNTGRNCSNTSFIAFVNLNTSGFFRIHDRPIYLGVNNVKNLAESPLGIIRNREIYYGCYMQSQFGDIDLNLDGDKETIIISGSGDDDYSITSNEPEFSDAKLFLSVYSDTLKHPIFEFEIVSNNMDYSNHLGKRVYSKLFFEDFNKNDKLDVFILRRHFNVTFSKGYKETFTEETYELYEEQEETPFKKHEFTQNVLKEYVKKYDMKWVDGFPSKNICPHGIFGKEILNSPLNQGIE